VECGCHLIHTRYWATPVPNQGSQDHLQVCPSNYFCDVTHVHSPRRIRDNQYDFPSDKYISAQAQLLIQLILTPNPQERPTLHNILDHAFFTLGIVPPYIPQSAHDSPPDFKHVGRAASAANLAEHKRNAGLVGAVKGIAPPGGGSGTFTARGAQSGDVSTGRNAMTTSIAQQEKEFQKAVQPGSPISALLSSARQPLIVAGGGGGSAMMGATGRESTLFRKLANAAREKELARMALGGIAEEGGGAMLKERERGVRERGEHAGRKALESQKARIVAQMVPAQPPGEDQENVPPLPRRDKGKGKSVEKEAAKPQEIDIGPGLLSLSMPAVLRADSF
jgi:cell cycle serine/threonine-protein kinase CDC5/MSD2